MRRLMIVTITALAVMTVALTGVASAESTATLTWTLEYSGSYSFHRDRTSPGSSGSTDEQMTWSYRGEASVDFAKADGYQVLPLQGSVAIGGTDDSVSATSSQNCTLAPTGENKAPGNFAIEDGLPVSVGVFVPESFVTSTNCQLTGLECLPSYCSDACLRGPPTTSNSSNPDPVWAPSFGPFKDDDLFAFSRGVDMRDGTGTATNGSCYGGSENEQVAVKSHVAFGLGWEGPMFFVDFPDGPPSSLREPATLLQPHGKVPQTTPTVNIPPKIPEDPTGPGTPLIPGIGIGCPTMVKKCPTTITVTVGNKKLASATVTVKRGTNALAGLKLEHLSLGSEASKKVEVAIAVTTGKILHRGSRQVTLTRTPA
jgi:hypothetical protein